MLARQPYTAKRLADKLLEKGFPQQEAEGVIEWCIAEGYLNDAEWAAAKAAQKHRKGWDRWRISAYLRHYGISREDCSNALDALDANEYE